MPNLNKTQKHTAIIVTAISALVAVMVLQTSNAQSSKSEVKSVGWYTANIKVAEAKNKECRSNSENVELKNTPECANALQALELSFGVKR